MWPSTVTWPSAIASSRAAWVFGDARLISSATRMLVNTGPGRNSKRSTDRFHTLTPTTSDGSRSGVNCRRPYVGVDRRGERLGEGGLADAGHVLDEEVALGEQADEREGDDVVLALDGLADVVDDGADDRGGAVAGVDRLLAAPWGQRA